VFSGRAISPVRVQSCASAASINRRSTVDVRQLQDQKQRRTWVSSEIERNASPTGITTIMARPNAAATKGDITRVMTNGDRSASATNAGRTLELPSAVIGTPGSAWVSPPVCWRSLRRPAPRRTTAADWSCHVEDDQPVRRYGRCRNYDDIVHRQEPGAGIHRPAKDGILL